MLSSNGKWAPVRCALNSCRGCYGLKSLLRAQMVYEDSLVEQPRYSITFTTKQPTWDAERYREGKRQVLRALRKRFGRVELLEFIEQTTGTAPRSGGHRRGHGHNLVKMDQPGQVLALEALVGPIWLAAVGASQVNVAELQSAGGAVAYLTLNLALEKGKASQAPVDLPKGTRTLRPSQGYWSTDPAELRRRAAEHHSARRLRHALMEQLDDGSGAINGDLLELWFEVEWERQQATTWTVWEVVEPQPTLDLTTGELIPGHVFEPIGELQPSRIPADLRELLPQRSEVPDVMVDRLDPGTQSFGAASDLAGRPPPGGFARAPTTRRTDSSAEPVSLTCDSHDR